MDLKGVYGLETLKEILLISGLFDVNVDGTIVCYRSKRELRDSPVNENLAGLSWSVIVTRDHMLVDVVHTLKQVMCIKG